MTALGYLDFDLEVDATATPDDYRVSVLASPSGEASGQMTFPFNPDALENVILKLGRTRSGVRAIGSPTQQLAKQFGSTLYDSLFSGEVGICFRRSLDAASAAGKGLRVRLRLGGAPQLAEVPWEYLYPSGLKQFLVLSTKTPIVRYLERPQQVQPLAVSPPLQVLVVVSSPTNLATLDVAAEVRRISAALAELENAGQVQLTTVPNATLAELRRTLRRGTFHVLHFIGHGGFNDQTGEGMLAFEDEHHLAHLVSGSDLATMIHDHESLRLVLLNACEGARQSPADPLGGVAQSLVEQGIPAVVAMQFEITDAAATTFSAEFYAALADGYPIDAALAEARIAVFSTDNDVEWGTPVLYLRATDGRIFDLADTSPAARVPHRPPPDGPRVIPVVVPPWGGGPGGVSNSGGAGASSGGGGSGGGTSSNGGGSGGGTSPGDDPPSDEPAPSDEGPPSGARAGLRWALIGAVAAVLVVALILAWPMLFPGGGTVVTPSPGPAVSISPSPGRTRPSAPPTTPSLPPIKDVGTLQALRGRVTIDGNTDDWQWQLVSRAQHQIAGKSDATGDIYLMWDDDALYLLALVADATQRSPDPAEPSRVFRGDSVILELGPDKSRLSATDLARPTDAYYMFGLPSPNVPVIAILGPNPAGTSFEAPRDPRTLDAAINVTRTGYVLEAKIPWATTRLNGIRAGTILAANVQVSERTANDFSNLGMRSTNPQRTAQVRAHPAYWQGLALQG